MMRELAGRLAVNQVMVHYTVKPEQAAQNEELVRAVYEELHQTAPSGIRYATFVLEDGVSFVHVASNEAEDGRNPLMEVAAFRTFQEGIGERCEAQPVRRDLREVGSYGFWSE
jgi:hypothetical protein